MPDCDAMHLVHYFFEIGPTVPAGMSEAPIPWSEIEAWEGRTGIELSAWESRVIRRLSVEYIDQIHKSRDPDCDAPFDSEEMTAKKREAVASQIRQSIRSKIMAKGIKQ